MSSQVMTAPCKISIISFLQSSKQCLPVPCTLGYQKNFAAWHESVTIFMSGATNLTMSPIFTLMSWDVSWNSWNERGLEQGLDEGELPVINCLSIPNSSRTRSNWSVSMLVHRLGIPESYSLRYFLRRAGNNRLIEFRFSWTVFLCHR